MVGLLAHGANPSSLMLRSGDALRVTSREESGAYVMGEVIKPMTAIPKPDGHLSLADALSQAGSFNAGTSDPRQLYVVRGAKDARSEIYHLDARSPVAMVMAARFLLDPDDVVYVAPTDLAVSYRVLSQLLPAIGAGLTGAVVTK
jgi:polysaccharide export outer membrane protein